MVFRQTGRSHHVLHVRSDLRLRFVNVGEEGQDDLLLHTGDLEIWCDELVNLR